MNQIGKTIKYEEELCRHFAVVTLNKHLKREENRKV